MQIQRIKLPGTFLILVLLAIRKSSGGHTLTFKSVNSYIDASIGSDVFFEIIYPPELEYTYKLRPAKDFGAPFNASFLEEGIPLVPTDPPHGCQVAKNAKELKGRIALIEREESITNPADYYYVEMIRDDTIPESKTVNIPVGFLLGKNGKMIRQTLRRLNQPFALINIPVNLTYTSLDKLPQPPWLFW